MQGLAQHQKNPYCAFLPWPSMPCWLTTVITGHPSIEIKGSISTTASSLRSLGCFWCLILPVCFVSKEVLVLSWLQRWLPAVSCALGLPPKQEMRRIKKIVLQSKEGSLTTIGSIRLVSSKFIHHQGNWIPWLLLMWQVHGDLMSL